MIPLIVDLIFLLQVLGMVALGLNALNDISVAAALCYYLQGMRCNYSQYVFSFPL